MDRPITPLWHLSALNRPHGLHLMGALLKGYIDDSGKENDPQHKHVCYGGYVAPAEAWSKFEAQWAAILTKFDAQYLHMKEFAHFKKIFESWKGEDKRRADFLSSLVKVIKKNKLKFIAAVINLDNLAHLNKEFGLSLEAEPLALYLCWFEAENHFPQTPIEFRLDRGTQVETLISKARDIAKFEQRVDEVGKEYVVHPIPKSESFQTILPLQAADFIAYECLKFNCKRGGADHSWTQRQSFSALLKGAKRHGGYWNYKGLLSLHQARNGAWPGTKKGENAIGLRELSMMLRRASVTRADA